MLVTLDIKNESMKEHLLNFIATLDYIEIKNTTEINTKGSSKKDIKEKAWKR